jgi:hypothetical protein
MSDTHVEYMVARIEDFVKRVGPHLWTALWVVLACWSGYNLGLIRASTSTRPAQEAAMFRIRSSVVSQTPQASGKGSTAPPANHTDPRVLASKASAGKKYHFTWCPGAIKIKEANRLWFPTAQAAQAAGYTLAGNCTQ